MSSTTTRMSISKISKIGALSALAVALMYLEFPIFNLYPWLKVDFGDVPALIGAFALGPLAGCIIEIIKVILFFFLKNSGTIGVGELASFILGIALVLPAALIYMRSKSRKRAIIGLSIGCLCMIILAPVLNYFVLIPAFMQFLPDTFEMGPYIIAGALPITTIKAVAESLVVILLYKRLSGLLHKQPKLQ